MNLISFPSSRLLAPLSSRSQPQSSILCLCRISSSSRLNPVTLNVPARDRVIDFGKHKGKMLGTLPSKYLIWISKTLRARNFEEWAKLADEVLCDPVYRDRLEWESAEMLLTGEGLRGSPSESPVSHLLEVSDRFGWDNADKAGWSRIDFGLLGTSMGGRIPRVKKQELHRESKGLRKIGEMGLPARVWESSEQRKGGILGGDSRVLKRGEMASLEKGVSEDERMGWDWRLRNKRKDGIMGVDSKISKTGEMGSMDERLWISSGDTRSSHNGFGVKCCMVSRVTKDEISEGEGIKVRFLTKGQRFYVGEEEEEVLTRGKIEERRGRRRLKRGQQMEIFRREVGTEKGSRRSDGNFVKGRASMNHQLVNPFPGRGALLEKIKRNGD